jgi:hypothetical protein
LAPARVASDWHAIGLVRGRSVAGVDNAISTPTTTGACGCIITRFFLAGRIGERNGARTGGQRFGDIRGSHHAVGRVLRLMQFLCKQTHTKSINYSIQQPKHDFGLYDGRMGVVVVLSIVDRCVRLSELSSTLNSMAIKEVNLIQGTKHGFPPVAEPNHLLSSTWDKKAIGSS